MSDVNTFNLKEPKKIPKWIKDKLEIIVKEHGKEQWFPKAWASYIKMCRIMPVNELPDPESFFKQENLKDGVEVSLNESENAEDLNKNERLDDEKVFDQNVEKIQNITQNDYKPTYYKEKKRYNNGKRY